MPFPFGGNDRNVNRRTWLKLVGTGTMAGLAGCNNSDPDTGTGDTETSSGGRIKDEFVFDQLGVGNPHDVQFNSFNPSNYTNPGGHIYANLAFQLMTEEPKYELILLDDYNLPSTIAKGETIELRFNTDAEWSNGDPVTAQDYIASNHLNRYLSDSEKPYLEWPEYVDDETVEIELKSKVNTGILMQEALTGEVTTYRGLFQEHLDAMNEAKDAGDDDAMSEAQADLLELTIDADEAVTNGIHKIARTTDTDLELEKHDGYPLADQVEIPTARQPSFGGGNEQRDALWEEGGFAASKGTGGYCSELDIPEDVGCEVRQYFTAYGEGLLFSHKHEDTSNLKVRHALAYLLNREEIIYQGVLVGSKNLSDEQERTFAREWAHKQWTNLTDHASENWYDKDQLATLRRGENNYQVAGDPDEVDPRGPGITGEPDREKAAQLLEDEGYYQENGEWYRPNDERFKLNIPAQPDWEHWSTGTVGQLQNFGIDATADIEEGGTFYGQTVPNGDWGVCIMTYGGFQGPNTHPYYIFQNDFNAYFEGAETQSVDFPREVDVPMPIGNRSYDDSDMETFNVEELINELGTSTEMDRTRELVQQLGWIQNWQLTLFPIRHYTADSVIANGAWKWPEQGGPYDMHPVWEAPYEMGQVQPKYE